MGNRVGGQNWLQRAHPYPMIGFGSIAMGIVGPDIDRLLPPTRPTTGPISIEQLVRGHHLRHRVLMLGTGRVSGEARHQLEDPATILEGTDLAYLEVSSVFDSLYLVVDGLARLAGAKEVQVHRMDRSNGRRSGCSHEGLRCDKPSVDPLAKPLSTWTAPPDVHIG